MDCSKHLILYGNNNNNNFVPNKDEGSREVGVACSGGSNTVTASATVYTQRPLEELMLQTTPRLVPVPPGIVNVSLYFLGA